MVVTGPDVGIIPLREVCLAVAPLGEWYVQLWTEGIRDASIAVGAYGYGGQKAARLEANLCQQLQSRSFTRTRLQNWIREHGIVLGADYPRSE
jgi:hypothetical protein